MKQIFKMMMSFMLTLVAGLLGVGGNVIMAAGITAMPEGGVTVGSQQTLNDSGEVTGGAQDIINSGIDTVTLENTDGVTDPDFLVTDLDKKVMKIRPMSTPLEQITRGKGGRHIQAMVTKYYSIGTRPVLTTLETAVSAQSTGDRVLIEVADNNIFTEDDTIRVIGVKGIKGEDGKAYPTGKAPDLMLKVIGVDETTGKLAVYAVNGNLRSGQTSGDPILVPAIAAGTKLLRMGKACAEIDAQTGLFTNLPTSEEQYCQNFMLQVEQSTFAKLWKNEVNWTFSDLEEEAVYDFKLTRELSSLFGVKNKIKHGSKRGQETYFTKGIWYMAGKDIELGHIENGTLVIDEADLVSFSKEAFIGVASTGRKVLFAGSDLVEAISKIKSERFRAKETVAIWDLRFTSFKTDFGEILLIHHELFNQAGMSDCGFLLEDGYLEKRIFVAFEKSLLKLKEAGIRNTDGVVLQEVSCLVLKNAQAHARVQLKKVA